VPRSAPDLSDARLPELRAHVRAGAENRPGVYRMLAADGEVLYVGKSKSVRTRLLSYFRCAYPEEKGARIIREAAHLEWEYAPSEFAALLLELRQIKRWRPRFNVQMKRDAHHWAFIKIARGAAPKLLVVRGGASEEGGVWYGPFQGARRVGEAVRELNDALGLRDCALATPMRFADQRELFTEELVQIAPRGPRCIRHEIRKCLGPCVAGCTHDEYRDRVVLARAFLDGADEAPLDRLRADMLHAAESLQFERAASLRDKLRRLEGLQEQFARLRFAVEELSFLYTVPGHAGDDRVYLVRRGRVRAEMRAPRRAREHARLRELAREVFAPPERRSAAVPTHEVEELLLLSSWFRRFPGELSHTRAPELDVPLPDPLDDEPELASDVAA
jgi:excinuclease ABC subunit C